MSHIRPERDDDAGAGAAELPRPLGLVDPQRLAAQASPWHAGMRHLSTDRLTQLPLSHYATG